MWDKIFASLAIVAYLTVFFSVMRSFYQAQTLSPQLLQGLLLFAVITHAAQLYISMVTPIGVDWSLLASISVSTALMTFLLLVLSANKSVYALSLMICPSAVTVILADLLLTRHQVLKSALGPALEAHIFLSLIAYALLALAFVQALVFALQYYLLRHKKVLALPSWVLPLQTMETLLFDWVRLGWFFLSASILTGLLFVDNFLQQHVAHKAFFSVCAWLVFSVLWVGRSRFGWQGVSAIKGVSIGFLFLVIGFLGSKFVLEIILHVN